MTESPKNPEKPEDKKPEPPKPNAEPPKKPLLSKPDAGQSGPEKPAAPKTPPVKPSQPKTPAAKPPAAKPAASAAKPAVSRPAAAQAAAARTAAPRPGAPASGGRRKFMISALGVAWTGFALATGAALSTVLRFLYPNVLFEPKMSFKIGKPDEYEVGKVDLRWKDKYGIWVIRSFEGMYALSTVCTHLGCPPSWLEVEQKFKCPCHGSGFYKSGVNFEGPAPRPLERFRIVLADDGQIMVDKSKKFQQEKGEWSFPEAFLTV